MRAGSSSEPRARRRWPQLSRATTVPIAALVLVGGMTFVQVADGPHPTITTAPTERLLVAVTTPVVTRPPCHAVIHLGDSNLALAAGRFKTAYSAAGVNSVIDSGLGRGANVVQGRGTTALEAIAKYMVSIPSSGRCWVLELSAADAMEAGKDHTDPGIPIRQMADALGDEPTLWITPVLTSAINDWNLAASTAYDKALLQEAQHHPNITVLDWQDIALEHLDQFFSDGVHYSDALADILIQTVVQKLPEIWDLHP